MDLFPLFDNNEFLQASPAKRAEILATLFKAEEDTK